MNFFEHFKHIYEWNKWQFWTMNLMSLAGFIAFQIFDANIFVKMIVVTGVLVKIILSLKFVSVTPSSSIDNDQFSWKYLQSLPLSKVQLIQYMVLCNLFVYLPILVWFVCFKQFILVELFDEENFSLFFSVLYLLSIIILTSLASVKNMIQFPRLQFVMKNGRILFYQNLRKSLTTLAVAVWTLFLGHMICDYFNISFLKHLALMIKTTRPLWSFTFSHYGAATAFVLLIVYQYHHTIRIWLNEKLSYRKIEWNPRREFSMITMAFVMIILPFQIGDSRPKHFAGNELMKAIYESDIVEVNRLAAGNFDFNKPNPYSVTPLMAAALSGNRMIYLAVKKKSSVSDLTVNIKDDKYDGYGLIHFAVAGRNPFIVKDLIDSGVDYQLKEKITGLSPLHLASRYCEPEMADLLLSKGAEVDSRSLKESTPLHLALNASCKEVSFLLLEAGADLHARNKENKIPFDYISKSRDKKFSFFIEKKMRAPASQK